ncbi:MAG: lipopolysaccharide biosynthesis protein, partial [Bacteroidia bacterium]
QYYRDSENLKAFMWLALLYFVLVTCGTFLGIVVFKGGAQGSIIGKMLGTLLTMIFYLLLFFIRTGFKFKMRYARQMYIYGYPLVAYALLATTFDSLDRFFLNKNFSLGDLGQYNLAFVVASTIGVFLNSMQAAISPNIYKLANSNDPERHKKINSIYNYMLWATFFTVVCCIAVSYPFIYYYINPKYHSSLIYIPLLAAAFISRAYFMIYANPLFIHGKTLSLPIISIASVTVGVIANIILIRAIGIIGICFAVLIIKFTQALLAALYTKKVGLYDLIEYDLKSIHISFIIIIFSITIISTNIIPDIFGLQLKYILPLIIFTILFFVFNPQIKNIFKKSS